MKVSGKTRIALALEYPLLQHGGTEILVRELLVGLAERFEIVLVSGDGHRDALGKYGPLICENFFWDMARPSRRAAQELAAALVNSQVKLVHFHAGGIYGWQGHKAWQSPIYYLANAGVPCITTSHLISPFLEGFTRPDRPAWQRAFLLPKAWLSKAALLHRTQQEFLVSKHDQAQMRRFYPMFSAKIGHMYHSTLVRTDDELPQDQRSKTILSLGTFCERKGQAILSRAFASIAKKHQDWTLKMMGPAGPPAYRDSVKKIVEHAGITSQVEFIPPGDPRALLESAAIFAMPSLLEGLPLALQEALYHGCACVGSSVSGIPELIEHEKTGLLVPPGDEQALTAALDRLILDSELRTRLAQAARKSILEKGMLAEIMVERHARLYESILANEK